MPDLNLEQERAALKKSIPANHYLEVEIDMMLEGWLAAKRSIAQEVAAQESLSAAIMALRPASTLLAASPTHMQGFVECRHAAAELVAAYASQEKP